MPPLPVTRPFTTAIPCRQVSASDLIRSLHASFLATTAHKRHRSLDIHSHPILQKAAIFSPFCVSQKGRKLLSTHQSRTVALRRNCVKTRGQFTRVHCQ